MARRRPVSGSHAALHHIRQRASHDSRGLHRQDNGMLDLHMKCRAQTLLPSVTRRSPLAPRHRVRYQLLPLDVLHYNNKSFRIIL